MNIKLIPFLLFLHALSFSSHFNSAGARGGSDLSGSSNFARSTRHLFDEKQWSLEKHLRHLDKLAEGYMSNADLELAMKEFNHRCSNISRIYSIGESVLGVPLWVMEISDKAGKEEPEPAFKFIGNVHGDEPVGRELLMLLANWLCNNYMKDYLATLIVDNVHLHLLPSLNPDGFSLRRRGNANNVDLNRDFPDQFFPMNDDPGTHQPETKAIMKWLEEIRFTASASLHGGALVANYPWDGTGDKKKEYSACPDDETFRFMASIYSNSHRNMSLSKEFPGGITNGALWYPIYGGMQDWNYIHNGCFELTLEISDNKWPNITEIPDIWEFNKMGMLSLVASLVKSGIHGRVFSSDLGSPLPASISIKGINYTIKAGEVCADYHRLVAPGEKYEVEASMPGYKSKGTSIIHGDEASTVDFILEPLDAQKNGMLSRVICDCGLQNGGLKLLTFSPVEHLEVYFIVIPILLFLCFLMRRRMVSNRTKQKQLIGPKRPIVV